MAYEIKEKKGKFYVVDTETNRIRGGPYDDEDDADDRMDELTFRSDVRAALGRIPGKELTADEKAAAYDKMMADKENEKTDPNVPPKKDPEKEPPKKVKRSAYWGEAIED